MIRPDVSRPEQGDVSGAHRFTRYVSAIRKQLECWFSEPATMTYRGFAATQIGKSRGENADLFRLCDDTGLYLIADGFGPGRDAQDAANIAISSTVEQYRAKLHCGGCTRPSHARLLSIVNESFSAASRAVTAFHDLVDSSCGASMAAVVCSRNSAIIASIGSCRVFLLTQGRLIQLTDDDTLGAEMRRAECRPVISGKDRFDKLLSKYLGDGESFHPNIVTVRVRDDDRLLMLTDGIYRSLDVGDIASIAASNRAASVPVKLVGAAKLAGSSDDCAAVTVSVMSRAKISLEDYDTARVQQWYASLNGLSSRIA